MTPVPPRVVSDNYIYRITPVGNPVAPTNEPVAVDAVPVWSATSPADMYVSALVKVRDIKRQLRGMLRCTETCRPEYGSYGMIDPGRGPCIEERGADGMGDWCQACLDRNPLAEQLAEAKREASQLRRKAMKASQVVFYRVTRGDEPC